MPASSAAVLRDFESQFDTLLAAILNPFSVAPYALQLCGHNTTDVLLTPRLEYEFGMNEPIGPEAQNLIRDDNGAQTAFSGTLSFRHVYDHTKTTPAQAAALRGALRTLLSPETRTITATNLPYLEITALTEVAAARSRYKDEKEKLLTEWLSTWGVSWMIRPGAWPDI